jgi:hypothetical protein
MSRPVVLTNEQWLDIRSRIINEHGLSTVMLSWRMKEKLGFTVRVHEQYSVAARQYVYQTCLDFYNEPKRTMFLLKYGDCIDRKSQETAR